MKLSSVLAHIVMAVMGFGSAAGVDWPNWRGPAYDGISEERFPSELPATLPILWKTSVGTGFCTVSVVGDRVLTMGNQSIAEVETDVVWCLSESTGEVLWKHTYPCALDPLYYEGGPGGTPTIHDGSVYTLSKKGHAFRLDLESGAVIWSRDLVKDHDLKLPEWSFAGSAFVDGDRVLLSAGEGGIALDSETGKTLWITSSDPAGYATVVPYEAGGPQGNRLLFSANSLFALDSVSGRPAWEFPWKSSRGVNAADPIVIGKRIVISSSSGTVMIEPSPGSEPPTVAWEQKDMKWYFNPGVLIAGHLYSLHGTTHRPTELMCTNVETGEIVWSEPGFGSGGLMAAGATVIVFDLGKLTIFDVDPKGYQPRHQQVILEGKCWTSPVFADQRIYCRNAAGDLACVGLAP